MILHLFDDEKVVGRAISFFEEAFPLGNIYVIRTSKRNRFVDDKINDRIILYNENDVFDTTLIEAVHSITIHYLNEWKVDFINNYFPTIKHVKWSVWGADMYNDLLVGMGYDIYYEPRYVPQYYKIMVERLLYKIGYIRPYKRKILHFISGRVTELGTSSEEYQIQKLYLRDQLIANYNEEPASIYYSIEDILGHGLKDQTVTGNDIMIGNSGSDSNNHLYVYKYLSKLNTSNRKIVVPLSYGGDEKHRIHVINKGQRYFGSYFYPLLKFLPLQEYNKVQLNSSVCLYGNWRQEAVGNITISLFLGAKVFLSKKSPLLINYRRKGLIVFCLEEITQEDIDTPLTEEQIRLNRMIIFNSNNRKTIIEGIRKNWK